MNGSARLVTSALLATLLGMPLAASARVAVVTPADDQEAPRPFPYPLPEGHSGTLPLSWTYVAELVPLVATGATAQDACDRDEVPSTNVVVAQAMQLMAAMDIEGAVDLLDDLLEDLPCLRVPISARELARVYYYRGAALAFLGEFDGAAAAMGQALAVDRDLEGDPNLPPEIDEIFEAERRARSSAKTVPMALILPRGVEARLDGNVPEESIALAGAGLLQWELSDGSWRSVRLVEPSGEVVIGTTDGIRAHLESNEPEVARLASSLCESLATALRVDAVLLYDGTDGAMLWEGRGHTVEWLDLLALGEPPDVGRSDPETPNRPDRPRTGGGTKRAIPPTDSVRLAFGGGVSYLHPFPYATANLDGTFRVYRSLCIGLGVDLGFPVTGYRDPVLLPVLHGGLRLRFGGKVHPFVGVAYRIGLDDRPGVTWAPMGVGLEIGLDIPMTKVLMLRVSGQGGVMGIPNMVFQSSGTLSFVVGF